MRPFRYSQLAALTDAAPKVLLARIASALGVQTTCSMEAMWPHRPEQGWCTPPESWPAQPPVPPLSPPSHCAADLGFGHISTALGDTTCDDIIGSYVSNTGQTSHDACANWLAVQTVAELNRTWVELYKLQWWPPAGVGMDEFVIDLCQTTCDGYGVACSELLPGERSPPPPPPPSPPFSPPSYCAADLGFGHFSNAPADHVTTCSDFIGSYVSNPVLNVSSNHDVCAGYLAVQTVANLNRTLAELYSIQWSPPAGVGMDELVIDLCQTTCDGYGVACSETLSQRPAPQ